MQAAFVKEATRINDAFEDSYVLALSSPRIALTPVVRDMQQLAREMAELDSDQCGPEVQEAFAEGYGEAIEMMLTFTQDSDATILPLLPELDMRSATTKLEIYRKSVAAVILNQDETAAAEFDKKNEAYPEESAYLQVYSALDARTQCEQAKPYTETTRRARQASSSRFSTRQLPVDSPSINDADPCAEIPIVDDPRTVSVEYRLTSPVDATIAETVVVVLPDGKKVYLENEPLPYTFSVDGRTGRSARIVASRWKPEGLVTCESWIDGNLVVTATLHPLFHNRLDE